MPNLLVICSFGLNVLILIVSISGFLKIMKNDLTHLQKSLDELKSNVKGMDKRMDSIAERLSTIEGRLK